MEDHHEFLARHIIAEDKLMTYRTLSRSMKVHVNLAKQMLYDFHKTHIAKFPGSLHVTYLVYGTRKTAEDEQDDDDVDMTDSVTDMDATFSQAVPTRTLTVVREEALQETLEQYAEVTSIHIYSVAPHPMRDLQFLADAAQQVVEMSIQEDFSVGANKTYGTLINPNTRRRERRAGAPPPAAPAKAQPTINLKEEPKWALTKEAKDSKPAANTTAKKVAAAAAPALKRQGSSGGIGQMFAKQASKPKKPAAKPKEEAPAPALSDEGEDDSEAMPEAKQAAEEDGKSRRDRQAELRRMMDESDDEEEESKSKPESPADEPMDEDPAPPEPEPEAKEEEGPAEIVASSGDGRRRGRRRVMKKKQIMDEQGYLVTIQEQGWESFSEEEKPAPKPQKAKPAAAEKAAPAGKSKKAAPKGQGNIMSFFGKK
ncbi:DNA polymerase subunit Cdc27 [Apiospora arundinis]